MHHTPHLPLDFFALVVVFVANVLAMDLLAAFLAMAFILAFFAAFFAARVSQMPLSSSSSLLELSSRPAPLSAAAELDARRAFFAYVRPRSSYTSLLELLYSPLLELLVPCAAAGAGPGTVTHAREPPATGLLELLGRAAGAGAGAGTNTA